jgi:hypothetical protein
MLAAVFFCTGLVPFLQHHLHGGAALYGLQGAVFGSGLVLSSWLIGLRPARKIGQIYCLGLVVNGVGNSLFALAPSVWYLLPAVFLAGLGRAGHAIGERTILQTQVPPEVRGRVFALWGTVAPILWAFALPLGGWMSDHASAQAVLLCASGSASMRLPCPCWDRPLAAGYCQCEASAGVVTRSLGSRPCRFPERIKWCQAPPGALPPQQASAICRAPNDRSPSRISLTALRYARQAATLNSSRLISSHL